MGDPAAASVVRVLAIAVIIDGAAATPAALMQREFRQGRLMLVNQVNTWLAAGTSVLLAVLGAGAMSLAVGRIAGSLASAVVLVRLCPEPLRFGFDRTVARSLLSFGLPLAGASIIVCAVTNVDQLVVGNVLGATALGYYVLAFNLSSWPVNMFSQPVRSVAPAAFARLQHDPPGMHRAFLASVGLLTAVTLPVCLMLPGASEPLIRVVYGSAWEPAADALVWLAILGALRILYELIYDYFVVLARSRVVFTVQLLWLGVLVPALVLGAHADGIFGVGVAHVAVGMLLVLPLYLRQLHRVGIPLRDLARQVALPLLVATAVGGAALVMASVVPSDLLTLAGAAVATVGAIALLLLRKRAELRSYLAAPTAPADRVAGVAA
jgi:PST family polysaccharide transporter